MSLSFVSWMVVAVAVIVAETLVVYLLRRGRAGDLSGVVYLAVVSVRAGRGDRGAERRRCWFPLHPAFREFRCLRSAGRSGGLVAIDMRIDMRGEGEGC
jgi:hypothetical protein